MAQRADRLVTDADIAAFWRDGAVCLRGVISEEWPQTLEAGFEAWQNSLACMDYGADGNSSPAISRRALSVRYCGDDMRFKVRKGVPQKPRHAYMREGDAMDHEGCPGVWNIE